MVDLAPDAQQTKDPYYLNQSKSIEQPKPDQSTGIALSGAGDVIAASAKLGEDVVKDTVKYGLQRDLDPIVKDRERELENAVNATKQLTQNLLPGSASQDTYDVPKPVQEIGPKLQQLEDLKGNGKVSNTDYLARRDAVLSDWRSRYSGYRDYIDHVQEQITGIPAANARIQSLISDYNSYQTNIKKQQEQVGTHILNAVTKGQISPAYWDMYTKNPGTGSAILGEINKRAAIDTNLETMSRELAVTRGSMENTADITRQVFSSTATVKASRAFEDIVNISGLKPMKLVDLVNDINSGRMKINDLQARELADVYDKHLTMAGQAMDADLDQLREDKNGRKFTWRGDMKPEQADAAKNSILSSFKRVPENLVNKEFGAAYATDNYLKAVASNTARQMVDDPAIGRTVRMIQGSIHLWPGAAANAFEFGIKSGFGPKFNEFTTRFTMEFGVPDANKPPAKLGQPAPGSLGAGLEELAAQKDADAKLYKYVLELPKAIKDPSVPDPSRLEMIKNTYGLGNMNIFDKFNFTTDHMEKGYFKPGKFTLFNTYTSKDQMREVERLTQGDTSLRKSVLDTTTMWFGTLHRQAINDLSQYQDMAGFKLEMNGGEFKMHIPDSLYKESRMTHTTGILNQRVAQMQESVDNLNRGLKGFYNVAEAFHLDPQQQALSVMKGLGFDPNKKDVYGQDTVVGQVLTGMLSKDAFKPAAEADYVKTPENTPPKVTKHPVFNYSTNMIGQGQPKPQP